jgi:hypothetical protein
MRLEIELPAQARRGTTVPITLRLVNPTAEPVEVVLQGRPTAFDVVVTHDPGEVVWRRLEGEVISAILQLRTVQPGDSLVFEAVWDQRTLAGTPAAPGEYLVTGEIPSDPPSRFRSAPKLLRILP